MMLREIAGHQRVLLLQGPIGPFFRRLARHLQQNGCEVFKINLNGGDWLFYRSGPRVTDYRGKPRDWPGFLTRHLVRNRIQALVLFGDCRFYHRVAIRCARRLGIPVYVFEEGYVRPDYVTLERDGVNGFSSIPRDPEFYRRLRKIQGPQHPKPVGKWAFWGTVVFAILYGLAGFVLQGRYPRYRHHRKYFSVVHWACGFRSYLRRVLYQIRERGILESLTTVHRKAFFLVALQVYDDAQVEFHSRFAGVEEFMEEVIASFARHAHPGHLLVFKHHPVDRGFRDYTRVIRDLAVVHGVQERVLYVHDLHLPTLLDAARGTVVINSTVGLSSALHGTPVMVLGDAVYDIPGVTFPGRLDQFWTARAPVDRDLFARFSRFLIHATQVNGSFYSPRPFDFSSPTPSRALARVTLNPGLRALKSRSVSRRRGRNPAGPAGQSVVALVNGAGNEGAKQRPPQSHE